ncbi:hypothetical protein X801_01232, partial [Opisthorchis viverrini]
KLRFQGENISQQRLARRLLPRSPSKGFDISAALIADYWYAHPTLRFGFTHVTAMQEKLIETAERAQAPYCTPSHCRHHSGRVLIFTPLEYTYSFESQTILSLFVTSHVCSTFRLCSHRLFLARIVHSF